MQLKDCGLKISYFILVISIIIPTTLLLGCTNYFTFIHTGFAQRCDFLGHIPNNDLIFYNTSPPTPGFYALIVAVSEMTHISYDLISFLPIQRIFLIILIFVCLRLFTQKTVFLSFVVLIYSTFSRECGLEVHDTGVVLLYLIIFFTITLYKYETIINSSYRISAFIIIFLSFLAMNYVSYKTTFMAIVYIFSLLIIEYCDTFASKNRSCININRSWLNLLLICLVITFSFNGFVYSNAIPISRAIHEIGLEKISLFLGNDPNDVLGSYGLYFIFPQYLNYIKIVRLILIFFLLIIMLLIIVLKYCKSKNFSLNWKYKIFLGMFSVALFDLVIYNMLGLFDTTYVVYAGFIALAILLDENYILVKNFKFKYVFIGIIMFLTLLNLSDMILISTTDKNVPLRDNNYFNYIEPSSNWIMNHVDMKLSTDVLTRGYVIMKMTGKNISNYPSTISSDDILFAIQANSNYIPDNDTIFMINYKQDHFSIRLWRILRSLRFFKFLIDSNPNLDSVYSDGSISCYVI